MDKLHRRRRLRVVSKAEGLRYAQIKEKKGQKKHGEEKKILFLAQLGNFVSKRRAGGSTNYGYSGEWDQPSCAKMRRI